MHNIRENGKKDAHSIDSMFTEILQRQKPEKKMEEQPEPVLDAMANGESHVGEGWSLVTSRNVRQVPSPLQICHCRTGSLPWYT